MLYPLAGIAPPGVRREVACAVEKNKQERYHQHPLYEYKLPRSRLKSRKSFVRHTTATTEHPVEARRKLWEDRHPAPSNFVALEEKLPPGHDLQWPIWKSLNRLRAQVGRCRHNMCKWGLADPPTELCDCGAVSQTMEHMLTCPQCPDTCTLNDLHEANAAAISVATYWANCTRKEEEG